jgi:hypothetical protein
MNLDGLARNLRVLWRADAIIAQAQLQHILVRLGLRALAAMVALFGLLSLELASYFSLVQRLDAIVAALILGAINLTIALTIVLISARQRPNQDLKLAAELHKSAFEALQSDAAAIQAELSSLKSAFSHPLDSMLAGLVVPAAGLLVKALKKSKAG